MSLLKKQFSMYFSSNPLTGATNVSADGSSFSVQLNQALAIPSEAVSCSIRVVQASVWNVSYNISAAFGNNVFNYTTGGVNYNIVIPDGLYSLSGLNSYLQTQFVNSGLAANLITITGDDATQRVILTFLKRCGFVWSIFKVD